RWPAAWPQGLVYDHPVSTLDLLPTALAIAGEARSIETPDLDGVDLAPFMTDPDAPVPHHRLFWSRKNYFVVREGDLKLVVTSGRKPLVELFDIQSDPTETRNLAGDRPGDVIRMWAMHTEWNARNQEVGWNRSR
ncbi:MAG: hypothetical protein MK085_13945, partial [Phycisphaerales bacterium]|nr:hypothetical protein [Phycisphaerales bacterium]